MKNLPAMQENWVQSLGWKIPWRREWLPTLVFWPGEFHGLYSPWALKELDTTERFSLHTLLHELLLHENKAVPVFIKHTLLI